MIPDWLHVLSMVYLALGGLSAIVVGVDVARRPQHMWIMNIVWPISALSGTAIIVWAYFRYGVRGTKQAMSGSMRHGEDAPGREKPPMPIAVGIGALHCGSGCTIGDICAEWLAFWFPAIATWFGWHTIFAEKMFAVWILDYVFAWCFGIAFQYFTIVPMRHLAPGKGLVAAIKADTLGLTAWQVGMYGCVAVMKFWVFDHVLKAPLETNSVEFWFVMQVAMMCGFVTTYPVNWWLIRVGIKERM